MKPNRQKLFECLRLYGIYQPGHLSLTHWFDGVRSLGFKCIQIRDKERIVPVDHLRAVQRRARRENCILIINDWVDLAEEIGADGVHLGIDDADWASVRAAYPNWVIGGSARDDQTALRALQAGVDYLGVGPIYPTSTKKDVPDPIGWAGFNSVAEHTPLPCVAIGGLGADVLHLDAVRSPRAMGLAFCSALATAQDIQAFAEALQDSPWVRSL